LIVIKARADFGVDADGHLARQRAAWLHHDSRHFSWLHPIE
jgi:hypothetical protein